MTLKINMSKRTRFKGLGKHHIVPTSRGGTSDLENIAIVRIQDHRDYHTLFINQTPEEIVETLVNKYWNGNWDYVKKAYGRNNGHNN